MQAANSNIAKFIIRFRRLPQSVFFMLTGAFVGLCTGLLCVFLKWFISSISHLVVSHLGSGVNPIFIVLPLIGIGMAVLFSRGVLKTNLTRGTESLIAFLRKGGSELPKNLIYGPIIANSLTLGFGGSAGGEGPIAVTGAAVGSRIGKFLGLTPEQIRLLIGCGAGAGISAIFKAPIGGMLFTLEILRLPFNTFTVLMLLLSCIASWVTCFIFTGFSFDVYLQAAEPFALTNYLGIAVFGIFAGLYSLYYTKIVRIVGNFIDGLKRIWVRVLIAGLGTGVLLLLFPALYGEGYGVMDKMLNGHFDALCASGPFGGADGDVWRLGAVVAAMLAVKCIVVAFATYAGVAGDFAPTLFAGSLAGMLFAMIANQLVGCQLPVGDFALIGMCACFAGIIRAPFMAMFLTPEMTGNFTLFLPMVLASALSYGVVRLVKSHNYYHEKVDVDMNVQ